ncbi:phosphotransferase family protein [Paenibacillus sepulcri]|uniref:Aminoglycoside phosphotransferase family protein n=1 Tax=Paenibacillus sepulcri TaxID=359917 RepID=A0ABS7C8M6_9BACL|nr:aminoglycoside phosphotransferase family protein [Paenibacillus sepulcri]
MEVKYQIEDSVLMIHLNKEYGIEIKSIDFIPAGDSAYSYGISCADGQRYYMKLFDHHHDRQKAGMDRLDYYLPLTWSMYEEKLFTNLTYPIQTLNGDFKTTLYNFTVVLFNFIEGETLAESYPFSKEILEAIAESLAAIHRITPYIDHSMLLTETFDISFAPELEKCLAALESIQIADSSMKRETRAQVLPRKERILALLTLVRELRGRAVSETKAMVLCHGDIWGGNLIRHDNGLYFLDWESAILAPPELDLIGYIGEEFDVFLAAYEQHLGQPVTVNLDLLRFYSYRHHLRNLANWLMNILYRNTEEAQNENDLEMIVHHCMDRWDRIESRVHAVDARLRARGQWAKHTGNP